jgi:hypothetical protein
MASLVSAVGEPFAADGIYDLRDEMILPNGRAILGRGEFLRDARAHDFGQSVDVARVDIECGFDLGAHAFAPRLGAEDADFEIGGARVDALTPEFVQDGEHIARGNHDDVRREIANQLYLSLGLTAGHRDDRAAGRLRAVMRAETAGKKPIAIGDMHLHAGTPTGCPDGARDEVAPIDQILLCISNHGRPAGRSRRGVDPRHALHGHTEKSEGIGFS